MTDKLFDDFFKQKLEQHDSGSPMHVWEKVRRELHEKDDDKGVVWWKNPLWLLALLLFIGGGVTIGVIGKNNNWFSKPTAVENIASTENSNQQNDVAIVPATTNDASKENNSNTSTEKTNDSNTTLNTSDKTPAITNTVSSDDVKVQSSPAAEIKTKKAAIRKLIRKAKHQSQVPVVGLPVSNKAVANLNSVKENQQPKLLEQLNSDVNLSFAEGANKASVKSLLESEKLKAAIPLNPKVFLGCPTIGPPRRNDLYLEVYGAADNVNRSLTGTSSTPLNYIDKRKEAEKSQVGFSAGVRIAKNIGEKFLLKTGVNYSQINEHLKFLNEKDVRTVTVITTRTVTSGGQTITISDTTTLTQVGTSYNNYYNRYRTVDVPLILSYELGNSRNFSVGINAGVIFNITSWYRGRILDTSLSPVTINTSNTLGVNAWKKNIGLGLYGSLSIYKRLNEKMQLFFEPYVRYNLKPVNTSETVVKQKYMTTGLQVGIRYNLFHKRQRYVE